MADCRIMYKWEAGQPKKVLITEDEGIDKLLELCLDGTAEVNEHSLRYTSYECDPVTGEPTTLADLSFVTLRYVRDGYWVDNQSSPVYHVPGGTQIRVRLEDMFFSTYLTGAIKVLGIFWTDFVPGATLPPPELFDSNYELLPVPPDNQADPVTEYQGIMRDNDMKLWICIGETYPDTSTDTIITIETYDEAAPTVLVNSFTKSGASGSLLTLDSSLYILQDPGDQTTSGTTNNFSKWGGWITDPLEINEPYLEKQYPTTAQTVKLYYINT